MIIDRLICLVLAVVLCTDCFPNPCEATISAGYESGLFTCSSGRFDFLRHVLYLRSYKVIFVGDVTSYDACCRTVHFIYLDFVFLEILCFSSRVDFVSDDVFNFRFIHERMFWEELDDYPEVIQSSFLTLEQSARTVFD